MKKLTFNRIKELLARKGKTNIELALHIGVKAQTVSTWCRNSNQPELATIYQIADFLEIEARDLLAEKKDLRPVKEKVKPKRKKSAKKG
jgi:transcriptional regulator with XRE-family HTH domain